MARSNIWLVVSEGPNAGDVVPVSGPQFLIGRVARCHFRLTADGVADLHCALVARGGRFFLRNFRRQTGTRVAGRQVCGELELRDQDSLQVGDFSLRVRIAPDRADPATETLFTVVESDPLPAVVREEPSAKARPSAAKPPVAAADGKRRILVGRKDHATHAMILLRQREWEAARSVSPPAPPPPPPRWKNGWLAATAGAALVGLFAGLFFSGNSGETPSRAAAAPITATHPMRSTPSRIIAVPPGQTPAATPQPFPPPRQRRGGQR